MFCCLAVQRLIQIRPGRVHCLDEIKLPLAAPSLDAFLVDYGIANVLVIPIPDQPLDVISLGEAAGDLLPGLPYALLEIDGYASIERSIYPRGEDVDIARHRTMQARREPVCKSSCSWGVSGLGRQVQSAVVIPETGAKRRLSGIH